MTIPYSLLRFPTTATARTAHMATYTSHYRRTVPRGTRIASVRGVRGFHAPQRVQYAYKDDQGKDELKPRSTEYSKSGDDAQAAESEVAFDPSKTSPEGQAEDVKRETDGAENPLETSPANKENSKAREAQEGGAQKGGEREARTSHTGGGRKNGGGQYGGGR